MRLGRIAAYTNLLIAALLLLGAWALMALLASRPALKHMFDLTPQARATVDPATEQLLAQVRQQGLKLEFHLFFQPLYAPPGDEVHKTYWEITRSLQSLTHDLLRQYSYLGGDAVKVRDYNPDTEIRETREMKDHFAISAGDNSDWVVVALGNRHRKLSLQLDLGDIEMPNIAPTPGIAPKLVPTLRDFRGEEALTSTIKSLMISGNPVVYFLTGFGEGHRDSALPDGYSLLQAALQQQGFQVRDLALGQPGGIPDDASAVALLEPKSDFSEHEADVLMAYLKRGGRLFVDYNWFSVADLNTDGGHLGQRLGFELSRDLVFQKQRSATGSRLLEGDPAVRNLTCVYNPGHPITGPLTRPLSISNGREFSQRGDAPAGVRFDSIVRTDANAWMAVSRPGPTGILVFDYFAPRLEGALAPRDIGIVIDVDGDQKGVIGHAVLLAGEAFNNDMWTANRDLAMNIFNWMVERKVLVPVAADHYRAKLVRIGFDQVKNMRWLLIGAVPGLFLLLGIAVAWRRSRSK